MGRVTRLGATVVGCWMVAAALNAQTSVGRGAPDPIEPEVIVGSEGKGLWAGAGIPPEHPPIYATRDGAVPAGVTPLPHDIFTTKDFYQDKDLWLDDRYYRCNSAVGLEQIWGAYEVALIGDNPPDTAAWGFCDRDYPREQIVSPYGFKTAKEHYAALLAEVRARRRADRLHPSHAARLERPVRARALEAHHVVPRRDLADPHVSVATDARVPTALRAADVSLLGQQRAAMARVLLLARRHSCGASRSTAGRG